MALIYHQSSDPVYIKKIYLKLWRLRDEVEAVIAHKTALGEEVDRDAISKEYSYQGPLKRGQLELIQGGEDASPSDQEAVAAESSESDADAPAKTNEDAQVSEENGVEIIQRSSDFLPSEKIFKGMSVLSELGMDHMYFFCNHKFIEGQSIVIEFQIPNRFVINAEVVYCRAFNIRSRIISSDRLPYRVAVKFSFLKPGERTLLREFVASIEPKIEQASKKEVSKPQVVEDAGGGEGFDELDGLDL
ncbi:MAG: hypothetical protein Fur0010_21330 [Bdellovibrio sp.]